MEETIEDRVSRLFAERKNSHVVLDDGEDDFAFFYEALTGIKLEKDAGLTIDPNKKLPVTKEEFDKLFAP